MTKSKDWLEQTWEIKRNIARRYADVPISEQLSDMHARVLEEFRKRGWIYPENTASMSTEALKHPCVNRAPVGGPHNTKKHAGSL